MSLKLGRGGEVVRMHRGEGGVEGIPEKLFSETSPEFPRIFRENSGIFPGIQSSLLKSPEISVNPESNRIHVLLY